MDKFEHKLKSHVRTKMAKHKTIKKHKKISMVAGIHSLEDKLAEAEVEREREATLHDLVGEGMMMLFPDVQGITDRLNRMDNSTELHSQLETGCKDRIKDMEIEDLEDLVYFINILNHETGAWYWNRAKPLLQEAVDDRLYVLTREKENDDE